MMKKVIPIVIIIILTIFMLLIVKLKKNENIEIEIVPIVEYLDRSVITINTEEGILVNWRYLASDNEETIFKLYRDDVLIYTSDANSATCFLDSQGNIESVYKVETIVNDKIITSQICERQLENNYFDINLDKPEASMQDVDYTPNDCSVGDVDGDGEYEIFIKWDPSNSKDNSEKGKTDNVYIDCYRLDGTKLWRINLGKNIRAGAHYTQFLVADFDCDGYAEMTCKTADGTIDGQGNVIGDATADYTNADGYILKGKEYYTLFEGRTGAALDTIEYKPSRDYVWAWGDDYGNRVDRYLGAVAYLDGVHPSIITIRGYYTRMTACAYDVADKKLVEKWYFDTGNNALANGYGNGNHNCMTADVDQDGKQEIVLGSTCLEDDGTVLWCTKLGHGDALHVGDFLPDKEGIEVWTCQEDCPYGVTLIDAKNGNILFHVDDVSDTGRCCADNIWIGNDGAEFWGMKTVMNENMNLVNCEYPSENFLIYYDGDLERELFDGTITKLNEEGKSITLLEPDGYSSCNGTKQTPCLSADILGDWREELILKSEDGKSIRIYCTTYNTTYRIPALMQDIQYRTQIAEQNVGYNQPPHTSFFLGTGYTLPKKYKVKLNRP